MLSGLSVVREEKDGLSCCKQVWKQRERMYSVILVGLFCCWSVGKRKERIYSVILAGLSVQDRKRRERMCSVMLIGLSCCKEANRSVCALSCCMACPTAGQWGIEKRGREMVSVACKRM